MAKPREIKVENNTTFYLCTHCKLFKTEDCFEKRGDSKKRLRSWCKDCRKEEALYYHRTARLRMSHEDALFNIQETKRWRADSQLLLKQYLLRLAKTSSKNNCREFNLTLDDIIIPDKCPILECEFNQLSTLYTYSIDRIDNTKGYVKGNIQIITRLANMMKNAASNEELILFSKNILNYIKR